MKHKRAICALLCAVFICTLLWGCSQNGKRVSNEDRELNLWMYLHANVSGTVTNFGETEFAKEMYKRTGIKVNYLHPPQGQEAEQFNLMLASGELPDIIEKGWHNYPGGANSAVRDGYLIQLNDVLEKYAPNLTNFYKEHPETEKMVIDDEGNHFLFPLIREDRYLTISSGMMLRKDWLDDLGLEIPETIDEWETVLTAFKNEKGCEAPMSVTTMGLMTSVFAGAYGIINDFYHDGNVVKHGQYTQNYKEFLEAMKRWYDNGLIDRNFPTANTTIVNANILNGKSGAVYGSLGSGMGAFLKAKEADDPKFDLAGAPYAVLNKGDVPEYELMINLYDYVGAGITTSCENVDLAATYLDYAYSPDGRMLNNFGIENLTYTMIDGYPTYTDLIMNNPDGLSINYAMAHYSRAGCLGMGIQDKRYYEQYLNYPQQRETLERWLDPNVGTHILPPVLHTPQESTELAKITNDVKTYVDEMTLKFITGIEPLSNFDAYLQQLNTLGIERSIEIKQAAFDRYNKR